jgi:hypothetical protein
MLKFVNNEVLSTPSTETELTFQGLEVSLVVANSAGVLVGVGAGSPLLEPQEVNCKQPSSSINVLHLINEE